MSATGDQTAVLVGKNGTVTESSFSISVHACRSERAGAWKNRDTGAAGALLTAPLSTAVRRTSHPAANEAHAQFELFPNGRIISRASKATREVREMESYGGFPLAFEANQGQTDSRVDFIARTGGSTVFLAPAAAVFSISQSPKHQILGHDGLEPHSLTEAGGGVAVHMEIVGGDPAALAVGQDQLPGIVNYFSDNDPLEWHTNIPTFGGVEYQNIYPGINLTYYGNDGQLEYDFIVSPDADPSAIKLNFAGTDGVDISSQGDLIVHTAAGDFVQQKPVSYQEAGTNLEAVASRYVVEGTQVRFEVGPYDATRPLVIDPLVMGYSTYLGDGLGDDFGGDIAVDATGNVYVTGSTSSTNFPTTPGAFDTSFNGDEDAFVAKLSSNGTSLVYATYLGGARGDSTSGIAVDSAGNAYVTGTTSRSRIPTTPGAFDTSYNGGFQDAFVAKLSADGTSLVYGTYLGGSDSDRGYGIAVDAAGNAYVTGSTISTNFPTTPGAFDTSFNGINDAFMAKLSADGSSLVYGTYLGGSEADVGNGGIAVDAAGNAYVTGTTYSTDFPTTPAAFDVTYNSIGDAFVAKLNADGTDLVYGTYLGGDGTDSGSGIAVDAAGNAYVTGDTDATNFPTTPGAFDISLNGDNDAFVAKLNADGTDLGYGTYLGGGGSHIDFSRGIAVDASGSAYVTGQTDSTDFPTTPGAFDASYNGLLDAFVSKLSPDGASLAYGTYLGGGSGTDAGSGIAVDAAGSAYVIGFTLASDFPTTSGTLKRRNRGASDAFVTKFSEV